MELSLVDALISGGPVAVLAGIIFWMYRIDRKSNEKRIHDVHEAHSDRLEHLLEKDQESREDNTKALTELNTLLVRMNARKK